MATSLPIVNAWLQLGLSLLGSVLAVTGEMSVKVNGRDRTLWFRGFLICVFLITGLCAVSRLLAAA